MNLSRDHLCILPFLFLTKPVLLQWLPQSSGIIDVFVLPLNKNFISKILKGYEHFF